MVDENEVKYMTKAIELMNLCKELSQAKITLSELVRINLEWGSEHILTIADLRVIPCVYQEIKVSEIPIEYSSRKVKYYKGNEIALA